MQLQKNRGRALLVIDCSQSPVFPWDRRDRARLTINGGHLDFQYRVSNLGKSIQSTWGGGGTVWEEARNPRRPPPRYNWKSRWPPLMVRHARSRRSHGKIGDCEQSSPVRNSMRAKPYFRSSLFPTQKVTFGLGERRREVTTRNTPAFANYVVYVSTILDKVDGKFVPPLPYLPNQGWENGAFWLLRGFILHLVCCSILFCPRL